MAAPEMLMPGGLEELAVALARATPRSRLLAGGTDLVRGMHHQRREPDLLIDLSGVGELDFVRLEDGWLRVGATTTFATLQAHPLVLRHARCLAEAAAQVGSVQIRNVATLGGNIANASPCADGVTALVALDAEVRTMNAGGHFATLPLTAISTGSGRTCLATSEVITEISFPALGDERHSTFAKVGSRTAVSVARLSMALVATLDPGSRTLTGVRVGLGAVAEGAFREARLEEVLEGRRADAESAAVFAAACAGAVRRAIPGRYSLPYKERAVLGLAYDAWNGLAACPPCEPVWP